MADAVVVHLRTRGELAADELRWDDPEGLAAVSPQTRRLHLGNPLSRSEDDPAQVLATIGDVVAGRVQVMPGELNHDGEPVPALFGFDLMVSTQFRGRGLATKLVAGWRDAHPTAYGNAVNAISAPIYPKLGWTVLRSPAYQLVSRSRKFVASYLPFGAGPAGALVDLAQGARRRLAGFWDETRTRGLRAVRVDRMPDGFDAQLAKPPALLSCHRSAAWINWMLGCPEPEVRDSYRLFLVRDRDERVVAYFLLSRIQPPRLRERFRDVSVGGLKDWRIFDPAAIDTLSLVLLAMRELVASGVDVTQLVLPGPKNPEAASVLAAELSKLGFRPRDDLRMSFHSQPSGPLADAKYLQPESWLNSWANVDGLFL